MQPMMKSHTISWILLVAFMITVFKILYQRWPDSKSVPTRSFLLHYIDPVDAALCSIRGYRCDGDCDCKAVCGGDGYETITILPQDDVILHDVKLESGTYCVPKGFDTCHQESSVFVYSASGWYCAPRNTAVWHGNQMIACKNSRVSDNSKNVLMDRLTRREVDHAVTDFYELLEDGTYRYRCECGSKDDRGNAMVNILPFVCSVDYCLTEFKNASGLYGWKEDHCECGPHSHLQPNDRTSPCTLAATEVNRDIMTGRVECMTEKSFNFENIICPRNKEMLYFQKRINYGPSKFMERHITSYKDKVLPKEYPNFTQTFKGKQWVPMHLGPPP